MATPSAKSPQPLAELAAYLSTRREAILSQWRAACELDPTLAKIKSLSREEFNNMMPLILESLQESLLKLPQTADPATTARAHGLHRWHKAHSLPDTLNELIYLSRTLNNELRLFSQLFPFFDRDGLLDGQHQIARLMQETITGSVARYDELQRLQAANRASTLQLVADQMQELSQQRGSVLRESAHDLRGGFGLIHSAAFLLKDQGLSEAERHLFTDMLNRNLTTVQGLLTSLMDLSRLEAGQETLHLASVDAAELLQAVVDSAQPLAAERGILLQMSGPASLVVVTDSVMLQRIAQNLLLNALKYTPSTPERMGFVSVSWSAEGTYRWLFSIQDSGPGLPATTVGALAQQLAPTVEPTSVLGPNESEPVAVLPDGIPVIPSPAALSAASNPVKGGDGVGLQIVKRLCELLNANLDVETQAGRGTLFRIRMPMQVGGSDNQ